jgi:2-methylcitrate dehydratase PrpD
MPPARDITIESHNDNRLQILLKSLRGGRGCGICVNAIAIKERHFGPESADPEKFTDPVVLDLIEKITVEHDPSIPDRSAQGISEITTKDGRSYKKHIKTPHGFDDDPLSDEELEQKFSEMALKYMTEKQIRKIFDTIWNLEKLDEISKLTALMVF